MYQRTAAGVGDDSPDAELTATSESVMVAFAFTRLVLTIIILGSAALRGFGSIRSENTLLLVGFLCLAALGFVVATSILIGRVRGRPVSARRPWLLILLDSGLAIGVMAVIDAETSPLAWVALVAPVLETAVFFSMVPAAIVWLGLSIAFLALRLTLGVSDEPGVETLTLAIQQVLAVLLVSGPAALLSDGAQQRIDQLSEARRSSDKVADRLRRITEAASEMAKENSVESLLASVSRTAVEIGFDHADVVRRESDGSLTSHGSHSTGPFSLPPLGILTPDATEAHVATILPETSDAGQFLHTHDLASGHAIQISPGSASNHASVVLRVWAKHRASTTSELRAFSLLAGHARETYRSATLLSEAKAHSNKLLQQVRHDGLTGLANRAFVLSTLEERIANQERTALFFLDLDGFKAINDTLGHRAGDAALESVAERLRSLCPQGSLAGRMGGDEFIIILPVAAAPTLTGMTNFGLEIIETISRPMVVDGHYAQLGASVGLAVHTNGLGADQFISMADRAMYEAKRSGGGIKLAATSSETLAALAANIS